MHADDSSSWFENCGCELSPGCEGHGAAEDLGAALQTAVLALSAWMSPSEAKHYFSSDPMGREIAAALHKAGLLVLVPPRHDARRDPASPREASRASG
jgi:hypothetical protein